MKKQNLFIVFAAIAILALTACQQRYIFIPIPDDDTVSSTVLNINTLQDLQNAANAPDGSSLILNDVDVDPTASGLPVTFSNNVKVSGSMNVTDDTSTLATRSGDDPSVVIFEVAGSASVNIADLTVKVAESVANTIKGIVEVTTGTLTASNYNVVTVASDGSTSSTTTTGIALGAGATPEKVQVSASEIEVAIVDDSLDASDFTDSFEGDIVVTAPYDAADPDSFAKALAGGKVRLTAGFTITELSFDDVDEFTIDLNDNKLIVKTAGSIILPAGKEITIKNGSFETIATGAGLANANIVFGQNDVVLFDGVTYTANAGGLALGTDTNSATGSVLTIINSDFSTDGAFCIATNANKEDGVQLTDDVSIILTDSTFTSTNSSYDSCPIFFNITTDLTVDGCTITGDRQALLARGGTVVISDSKLISTGKFNGTNYIDKTWGSGNEVPNAALVVGNRSDAGVYEYDVNVSIDESSEIIVQDSSNGAFEVYASSCNGFTTTFTSAEYATGVISGNHYYQGEGSTLVIRSDVNSSNLVPSENVE